MIGILLALSVTLQCETRPADSEMARFLDAERKALAEERRQWNDRAAKEHKDWKTWDAEERDAFYRLLGRQWLLSMATDYGLTREQFDRAAAILDKKRQRQLEYSQANEKKVHDTLSEAKSLDDRAANGDHEAQMRRAKLLGELRALWSGGPFVSKANAELEVEATLPSQQVAAARERRNRVKKWNNEMDSSQERWQLMAAQATDPSWVPGSSARDPKLWYPLGDWKLYVELFIRYYQLDQTQRSTALSILREALDWRSEHERQHGKEYEEAGQLSDAAGIFNYVQPMEQMLNEMSTRLERIPTTAQREEARRREQARLPSTRPTSAPATRSSQ